MDALHFGKNRSRTSHTKGYEGGARLAGKLKVHCENRKFYTVSKVVGYRSILLEQSSRTIQTGKNVNCYLGVGGSLGNLAGGPLLSRPIRGG